MSHRGSLKFGQGGHIVIHNQNEDAGHTGVLVVSNTTPMEELDGINQPRIVSASKSDPSRKKVASKMANEVEKSVRIRNTRIPSAKSNASNAGILKPQSREDALKQRSENGNLEENAHSPVEQSTVHEREAFEDSRYEHEYNMGGRLDLYNGEEDNYVCYRFPHLKFCACGIDHHEIKMQEPVEVVRGLFIGNLQQSLISKNLLKLGITHVLNLSAVEFTKRTNYFEYLNFDIFDNLDEDIKKHFRITNRFITEALQSGGKVLVHSFDSNSRAPAFILAYLIGKQKKTLKNSMDLIKRLWPSTELNSYFYKQLEQYDLEKLAIGSSIKV